MPDPILSAIELAQKQALARPRDKGAPPPEPKLAVAPPPKRTREQERVDHEERIEEEERRVTNEYPPPLPGGREISPIESFLPLFLGTAMAQVGMSNLRGVIQTGLALHKRYAWACHDHYARGP